MYTKEQVQPTQCQWLAKAPAKSHSEIGADDLEYLLNRSQGGGQELLKWRKLDVLSV